MTPEQERRRQLEEWKRQREAAKKANKSDTRPSVNKMAARTVVPSMPTTPTPIGSQKSTTIMPATVPRVSTTRSPNLSSTVRKGPTTVKRPGTATAITKGGTITMRASVTPTKTTSNIKVSGVRSATPRARISNRNATQAPQTDMSEIRRRVLQASAKKAAQLRNGKMSLCMKLGMLSVSSRAQQMEDQVNFVKSPLGERKTNRQLLDELKAARSPEKKATINGSVMSASETHAQSIKDDQTLVTAPKPSLDSKTDKVDDAVALSSTTNVERSTKAPEKVAPKRGRLCLKAFEQIKLVHQLYQPVALRVVCPGSTSPPVIIPIPTARVLPWFDVHAAQAAAMRGEISLARAMFKILGAKPPGGLPVDGTRLDEVQWPYQSDTYWIMRAKFEEACGEITAAYHVYQEAMSTFVMPSDALKQALNEFMSRVERSGISISLSHEQIKEQPMVMNAQQRRALQAELYRLYPRLAPPATNQEEPDDNVEMMDWTEDVPTETTTTATPTSLSTQPPSPSQERRESVVTVEVVTSVKQEPDTLVPCPDPDKPSEQPTTDMSPSDAIDDTASDHTPTHSIESAPAPPETPDTKPSTKIPQSAPASLTVLTPVRASRTQKLDLGVNTVISPVRRSRRLLRQEGTPVKEIGKEDEERLARLLSEQGFAFVPNKALSTQSTASPSRTTRRNK